MSTKIDLLKESTRSYALIESKNGTPPIMSEDGRAHLWIFDFRAALYKNDWLKLYVDVFWDKYASQYPFQVGGIESVGIALVAAIVLEGQHRGTPVNGFFMRKSRKRSGLMKELEGSLNDHPIILVDDLINSGFTLNKQINILSTFGRSPKEAFFLIRYRHIEFYQDLGEKIMINSIFTLSEFGLIPSLQQEKTPQKKFRELWHFKETKPSFNIVRNKSAPTIDEELVYFGADDGLFRAIKQSDGSVAWGFLVGRTTKNRGFFSSPTVYRDLVFFGAQDGEVYALDRKTGIKQWSYSDADWVESSPIVAPVAELVFVGLEFGLFKKRGGIVALSTQEGVLVWKQNTRGAAKGSPKHLAEQGLVVIGDSYGWVYAYEQKTGKCVWEFKAGGEVNGAFAYDHTTQLIVFNSSNGNTFAIGAIDGLLRWRFQVSMALFSNPCVYKKLVYITCLDKFIYALDVETGEKIWDFYAEGRIFATPEIVEDRLVVGSNSGKLYELEPETGKLIRVFQAEERVVSKVAYNPKTKRMFVPTVTNQMYCLDVSDET